MQVAVHLQEEIANTAIDDQFQVTVVQRIMRTVQQIGTVERESTQ